ncbi:queuosine precursor transporter [Archaeoglobus profundus]|uniref:Probable queuosine precursor transporter n=1 Tax=Archaeoglobus profundus (strain DSM 5631 / JCM 9629 / NBRC 100127 / Av18) TaxID=572546 RepID=D2RE36_ARCPA|nr:queuosine precursor transporter [Archaeoglobus profundus]ADB58380.1 conserved hypothetical protein [Archaeoglobus profundus DSM 5631]
MLNFVLWAVVTLAAVTLTVITSRRYGIEIAVGIFSTLTVLANILANKIVAVGSFIVPAGVIVYSTTFLVTDVISEVYGKEVAKKAVICGFLANLIALMSLNLVLIWEPAPFAIEVSEAFSKALSQTPRIIIASLIAYIVSQMHDVYAFHFWKKVTKGKYLWLRNNASTVVSQAIDTTIFITLAFYGTFPLQTIAGMIFGQYIVKVIIALLDTPFIYIASSFMKTASSSPSGCS